MKELIDKKVEIITELFELESMWQYLISRIDSLSKWHIIPMVCCAAIPLKRKKELLSVMALEEEYSDERDKEYSYKECARCATLIIESLTLKENELYAVEMAWYDEESQKSDSRVLGLAGSYEKAMELIAAEDLEYANLWFYLNKWKREDDGSYTDESFYIYADGEIMYCAWDESIPEGFSAKYLGHFSPYEELTLLPTPFQIGDIIKIDCRPFAPVHNVLVLENERPMDCCSFQGLYVNEDGYFSSGAIKHKHVFPGNYYPFGSPLYRAELVRDFVEEDEILLKARKCIGKDLAKSRNLQKCISGMNEAKRREI